MSKTLLRFVAMLLWLQGALSLVYAAIAVALGHSHDVANDVALVICLGGIGIGVWSGIRFGVVIAAVVSALEILAAVFFLGSLVVYGKLEFIGLGVVEPLYALATLAVPTLVLSVATLATARQASAGGPPAEV